MANVKPVKLGKNTRMSFAGINEVMQMPNLIEVQKNSYKWFLDVGLREVFRDIDEITDYTGNLVLTFIDYRMDEKPKYSVAECKERDATYSAPLRVLARLYNKETGEIKENEVFMGDFPIMTESGTFVINGAERVIISQLVRSPGVYYGFTYDKNGKKLFTSTVIPNRGAWLEYETDQNDIFNVRIDKNRKLPITTFIRALGLSSNNDIREFFGDDDRIEATLEKDTTKNTEEALLEVYRKLRPGEPPTLESAETHVNNLFFDPHRYDISRVGRYKYNKKLALTDRIAGGVTVDDIFNPFTGELMLEAGGKITAELAEQIDRAGVKEVTLDLEGKHVKVISNNMVDPLDFIEGVTAEELEEIAINEKVRFSVLKEIIEEYGDDKEALLDRAVECMKQVGDHADKLGITIALEILNRFESCMINTLDEGIAFCERVGKNSVKLLLDTFHMNIEEVEDIPTVLRRAGDWVKHVHVGEANRMLPGQGHMDWAAIGQALRDINYDGKVVMEPFLLTGGEVGPAIKVWRDLSGNADAEKMDEMMAKAVCVLRSNLNA